MITGLLAGDDVVGIDIRPLTTPTGRNSTVGPTTGLVTIVDNEPGASYGLTTGNEIVKFSVNTPGTSGTPVLVTGLQAGEDLVGIDVRPAIGELYAVAGDPVTFTLSLGRNTRCLIQYATTPGQGLSPCVVVNVRTVLSLSTVRTGVRSFVFQGRNLPTSPGS